MKLARLAASLTAAVLLVSCADDPEPKVEPSESVSPSSAAPTPHPRQAQREFLSLYVAEMSESLSSGDPSGFIELSSSDCNNCRTFADNLHAAYADGGKILGASWKLDEVEFGGETAAGELWFVDVRSTRERWMAADGKVVKVIPAGTQLLAMTVNTEAVAPEMADIKFRTP